MSSKVVLSMPKYGKHWNHRLSTIEETLSLHQDSEEFLKVDFGDHAISRVTLVDSYL
ncbi:MAG: hypothetical protein AAGE84_12105 [Cyanobacteria bacterium P01_G01_bin.39]